MKLNLKKHDFRLNLGRKSNYDNWEGITCYRDTTYGAIRGAIRCVVRDAFRATIRYTSRDAI